jgi:outer membrane protein OmpU
MVPSQASAQTVVPGGALDLTLTGFARFRAHGGDLDAARLDNTVANGLDFSNDTEVHVVMRGTHDASGIEYGGTVEFEADTQRTENTDETWIFMRGGFGELRFGDEDGPVDNSAVAGYTVAAGTGGTDGSVIDVIGTGVVKPFNSDDDTKVRYYTPSFGGFSLGVSYTPNPDGGETISSKAIVDDDGERTPIGDPRDFVEGALVYDGELAGVGILASGVGSFCRLEDVEDGDDDCYTWGAGASADLFGFKLGGGYFSEKVGDAEKDFFNVGVGYGFGPVNLSVNWGQVVDSSGGLATNGNEIGDAYNLVFSADVGLMPGLVLAGDVAVFDNDADYDPDEDPTGIGDTDDNGVMGVARLGLAF